MCGISQQHFHGGSQVTQVQWWHLPQAWGIQQARSCRARATSLLPGRLLLRDSTSKQCLDHRHHFGLAGSSVLEKQQGFREVTCPLSLSPLPRTRVILACECPVPQSQACVSHLWGGGSWGYSGRVLTRCPCSTVGNLYRTHCLPLAVGGLQCPAWIVQTPPAKERAPSNSRHKNTSEMGSLHLWVTGTWQLGFLSYPQKFPGREL